MAEQALQAAAVAVTEQYWPAPQAGEQTRAPQLKPPYPAAQVMQVVPEEQVALRRVAERGPDRRYER